MIDLHGRSIDYLRFSVTDLCNLRCVYCMPRAGIAKREHGDIISIEEIEEIVIAAATLGIKKVRLTGGEPLVRRGIVDIVKRAARTPGIEEVVLTTNGALLASFAASLKAAGLKRINISIDALDPAVYRDITRVGEVADVQAGISAAIDAGLTPIKLNVVLIGGLNDGFVRPLIAMTEDMGLCVRFIEIMPIGECAGWNKDRFISVAKVLELEPSLEPCGTDGVAKLYKKAGSKGTVGLISPISNHFCPACNKLRVTSDCKLKPCLHSADEINLRGLHGEALVNTIREAILAKPFKHELTHGGISRSRRGMSAIGG